ncbi:glycosyltransferase family 39 protein [Gordonia sp. HY285]|uniref:glycosyltransferase family 39 protein n=1 Tax=Gordonia liuliyuniae TaxID=2911517 RepID=UPI001F1C124B|nr:glycosyltransferase family 39 protein [Gordonia liuliyuniae]MCF8609221.1 glycosyltransferase family 39 protein [Gordonia liuliyuniae]
MSRSETERSSLRDRLNGSRLIAPVASFSIGAIAVTVLFAIGAWQRRWIADDGLIVLRTVRNLLAGNGPVFNAGERVEANTSTAWTYIMWFFSWVTGAEHTEYVALWVALILSVSAIPLAMYGTGRLYGARVTSAGFGLLLPLGAIVYIALPPARDFATSGLENGLTIFWVAALWCQLIAWAHRRGSEPTRWSRTAFLLLSFTAGLAPLIRPEGAIVGVLVLLLLFCSQISWKMRVAMVVVAGALPVGYQIFRMGYYAVLVPNPAIAKDASGSKWSQGLQYLGNLFGPYALLLPVIIAAVVGVLLAAVALLNRSTTVEEADGVAGDGPSAERDDDLPEVLDDHAAPSSRERFVRRASSLSTGCQSSRAVVATMLVAGLILSVYWVRQGGDFMHGRVLLTPLFILLLPVMVVPVVVPATVRTRSGQLRLAAAVAVLAGVGATVWWGVAVHANTLPNAGTTIGRNGIVDERTFYVTNMANENPVTAEDYLEYPRMNAMVETIRDVHTTGGIILPSQNFDEWYVAALPDKMPPGVPRQTTVYFLNLGMTSMNAPLDVRVVDQMGLAYPLAAHTARLEDGRIGHDKDLSSAWVVAESGGVITRPGLPAYMSRDQVKLARAALKCPDTQERFASYQDTWTFARFKANLTDSLHFSGYRIARQPEYEILRCGLQMPANLDEK